MKRPVIGLALGSGGARGFAHLGVLKALHDAGIQVDLIAGSSMGALVGSLYCAGQDMDQLYKLARTFKRKYYLDFTVPKMGFIQGKRIKEYISLFTHRKNIEDLKIPFAVIATDLKTGEKVIFKEGNTANAVRASISIPGIFVPEKIGDRLLVDGGVVDRVPISVAREMGADIVIGVDCAHFDGSNEVQSIYDVIIQSIEIMQEELLSQIDLNADFMLKPDIKKYSSRAFTDIEEIVNEGEKEANLHIKSIRTYIEHWKEPENEAE
ncbi:MULTISPECIES: patatin-like phospholipase family protein [Pontibacillus]|uniref:Patatin-like phospholipase family protein n=1 Tax=Pontibacillus chungwhensis TaxID=265426 RepID=A0ABY8V4B1_9BACI|nr:patatin-like phospholipase family protein [Pontibacillus chungwhensis]MCD5322571.1 patatin-like phospholipase family protein [Pontibacillus sp. HN14]WIF99856.1 patatin-like phospholipase family protein [Pontibacillus chungwhensis]